MTISLNLLASMTAEVES